MWWCLNLSEPASGKRGHDTEAAFGRKREEAIAGLHQPLLRVLYCIVLYLSVCFLAWFLSWADSPKRGENSCDFKIDFAVVRPPTRAMYGPLEWDNFVTAFSPFARCCGGCEGVREARDQGVAKFHAAATRVGGCISPEGRHNAGAHARRRGEEQGAATSLQTHMRLPRIREPSQQRTSRQDERSRSIGAQPADRFRCGGKNSRDGDGRVFCNAEGLREI